MKKYIFILSASTFLFACGGEKKETTPSSPENNPSEPAPDTVKTDGPITMVNVSAEDSIAFYEALKNEAVVNDKFCDCVEKKGRDHKDCRIFMRESKPFEDIEMSILNKYYNMENYDRAAVKRMSAASTAEMERANACGE